MRPRISQKEAAYLVQVLTLNAKALEAKKQELDALKKEVAELQKICHYDTYTAVIKQGYPDKKERLRKATFAIFDLHNQLTIHQKLIEKYQAIANNQPHDGRYKHLSTLDIFYLDNKPISAVLQV